MDTFTSPGPGPERPTSLKRRSKGKSAEFVDEGDKSLCRLCPTDRLGKMVAPRTAKEFSMQSHDEWQEFDQVVLGGNYTGHHGNDQVTQLTIPEEQAKHPILAGISTASFAGNGSLYKVSPLAKSATPLLIGSIPGQSSEPVAWTHSYDKARVFYTSLGHVDDFSQPDFNRLLVNAVFWAMNKPQPAK